MTVAVAARPAKKAPKSKSEAARRPRIAIAMEPMDKEMIVEAARILGIPAATWTRRATFFASLQVRTATQNVPHGLHPGIPVYRVLSAPVGGVWNFREEFRSTGDERVWVSNYSDACPSAISVDNRALIIDVVGYGKAHSLFVRPGALRWSTATPLAFPYWDIQREYNARVEAKRKAVAEATP